MDAERTIRTFFRSLHESGLDKGSGRGDGEKKVDLKDVLMLE